MKINIIAHRGNNNNTCENKINCLIDSINNSNIDGIEIDVRMTKDKIFVLNHNLFILKDFKIINVDKSYYKELFIDKLTDLLNNIDSNKIIMIDMKCIYNYKKYAHNLIKVLKKYKHLNFLLVSFNYNLIKYIKTKYNQYKCGLIIGYKINTNKDYQLFDFISIHYKLINEYKFPFYIWGKDHPKINNNCIGIITN